MNKIIISYLQKSFIITMLAGLVGCSEKLDLSMALKSLNSSTTPAPVSSINNGVNIMDLGISGHVIPGVYNTNYTKPNLASLQFLRSRGNKVIRIPFLWERLQPTLGGALNTAYLGYIIDVLKDANTANVKIILDMHNYGRYSSGGVTYLMGKSDGPTINQYKDVWSKLVTAINAEPMAAASVFAYDIMNEPYSLPDTRNTIPDVGATPMFTFSSTVENWVASSGETVSRSASYNGSLSVSKVLAATGVGVPAFVGTQNLFMATALSSAAGSVIRIKGHLPANVQGTFPRIRLATLVNWSITNHAAIAVNKGEDFEIYYTLTPSQWSTVNGLKLELIINNSDGVGPHQFFIDDISQGTPITGKSPSVIWEEYSQGAVDAIRTVGDNKTIMVEGYDFASARTWSTNHPVKWITDSADNIIYSAHNYMDSDSSGTYVNNFATEISNAAADGYSSVSERSIDRVKNYTDWLDAQGAKGYIGEVGWPNSAMSADSAQWDIVGEDVLTFLDSKNVGYTFWSTGSWLQPTTNQLNIYDLGTSTPLSQSIILESHL